MNSQYDILFRLRVKHEYYNNPKHQEWSNDIRFEPTPSCKRLIAKYGFIFRQIDFGFAIYAEVRENGSDLVLVRPIGSDSLNFNFRMILENPYFHNITKLKKQELEEDIFYYNNLGDKRVDGLPEILFDAKTGGSFPVKIVPSYDYRLGFSTALKEASFEIKDLFGNSKLPLPKMNHPIGETSSEFLFDLKKVKKMNAGRYKISYTGNNGTTGTERIYLERGVDTGKLFGIVEIYNNTLSWASDDKVEETHQFLIPNSSKLKRDNNVLIADYIIKFDKSPNVYWHYVIIKNDISAASGIALSDVEIDGFEEPTNLNTPAEVDFKIFRSKTRLAYKEIVAQKNLKTGAGSEKIPLPNPTMNLYKKTLNETERFYKKYDWDSPNVSNKNEPFYEIYFYI